MSGWAYAAYAACGCCIAAVCTADAAEKHWTAKTVAGFIRQGYEVRRVSDDDIRSRRVCFVRRGGGCRNVPEPTPPEQLDLFADVQP